MSEPRIQQAIIFCQRLIGDSNKAIEDVELQKCIDYTVSSLRQNPINPINLSEEEIVQFRREMEFFFHIHQEDGSVITDDIEDPNWYTNYINEPDTNTEDGKLQKEERVFFWERYRSYLLNNGFPLPVVNRLGNYTLNRLTNLLGNPKSDHGFFRKGLVVGDVQSGKTATYSGLICKAADAGYRVVILMTGTIEKLRVQTQKRLEEAFVGFDMTAQQDGRPINVGVGLPIYSISRLGRPIPHPNINTFTTREQGAGDFHYNAALQLNQNDVFFFVIKKNGAILRRLLRWLKDLNANHGKIHNSLLLIDDEADNASINTRQRDDDPTVINALIRKLADVFEKTTYVGFTATPFANVFINPFFDEEHMDQQDLFPSNFIFTLEAPDNYVGPARIFNTFNEDGSLHEPPPEFHDALIPIEDAGAYEDDGFFFFYTHKRIWDDELPDSLTDSVYCFLLANVLRDLRGDYHAPRTMMVNMSRFIAVQKVIKRNLEVILTDVINALQYNLDMANPYNFENEIIERIYGVWLEQYDGRIRKNPEDTKSPVVKWEEIVPMLYQSNKDVELRVINSQGNDTLDYDAYERANHRGLRVIAIGGLALSRGLTLEGLVVSYFFRNTATYDVLMQMGRWFGYRRNYEDIFRIWMSPQSIRWYSEIADATEELKRDIKNMQDHDLKPKDFGIRVKRLSSELSITAAIKMRTATMITEYLSFTGTLLETPYAINDTDKNKHNIQNVLELIHKTGNPDKINNRYQIRDIKREIIIDFLRQLNISPYNTKFPVNDLIAFIGNSDALKTWDIGFPEGKGPIYNGIDGLNIRSVTRTIYVSHEENKRIDIGRRGKVGGTLDGLIGLEEKTTHFEVVEHAKELAYADFMQNHPDRVWKENYSSDTWFRFIDQKNRRPLLLIYLINPEKPSDERECNDLTSETVCRFNAEENPIVCFALGIPSDGVNTVRKVQYAANLIYTDAQMRSMEADNADVDED